MDGEGKGLCLGERVPKPAQKRILWTMVVGCGGVVVLVWERLSALEFGGSSFLSFEWETACVCRGVGGNECVV